MQKRTYLDLPLENGAKFYYREEALQASKDELEEFLEWEQHMNDLHFAKKVMFSHEIQANNQVEGYGNDVEVIERVIKSKTAKIRDNETKLRILNLYRCYQYILSHRKMDEAHLRVLYGILSENLLEQSDLVRMGEFYRTAPVYILKNGGLVMELEEGVDFQNIKRLMDKYFEFVNEILSNPTLSDEYIKSQIMHFYFVYIHPYFDGNGRTSRTMAMWYLLNKRIYPCIIFNRGISFKGSKYDTIIREAKMRHDITYFLEMMLDTLKVELEKEHIMQDIASNTPYKLNGTNYQTLLYFLTFNGVKSVSDFARFYNGLNDKRRSLEIYEEMISPLIDMDILRVDRYTKNILGGKVPNMILSLNPDKFDCNPNYLKRVKLK